MRTSNGPARCWREVSAAGRNRPKSVYKVYQKVSQTISKTRQQNLKIVLINRSIWRGSLSWLERQLHKLINYCSGPYRIWTISVDGAFRSLTVPNHSSQLQKCTSVQLNAGRVEPLDPVLPHYFKSAMRGFVIRPVSIFEKSLPVHELDAIRDELLQCSSSRSGELNRW